MLKCSREHPSELCTSPFGAYSATSILSIRPLQPTSRSPIPPKFPHAPKRRDRFLGEFPDLAVSVGRTGDMPTPKNVVRFPDPPRAGSEHGFVQCRNLLLLAHVAGTRVLGAPNR